MPAQDAPYFAYLLRIWRTATETDIEPSWRASLQRPGAQDRLGFTSLDALFAFLRNQAERYPASTSTTKGETQEEE